MSANAKRRPGGGGAAADLRKQISIHRSVTAVGSLACPAALSGAVGSAPSEPPQSARGVPSAAGRRRSAASRDCKIRHRLSLCPIDGFRVSEMDVGDLLIREPNGTWSLERVPEVAAHWGWQA